MRKSSAICSAPNCKARNCGALKAIKKSKRDWYQVKKFISKRRLMNLLVGPDFECRGAQELEMMQVAEKALELSGTGTDD